MAADLNDELLALAGDGSDEEEEYEEVEEEQSEDEGAVQEDSPSVSPPRPSIEKPTSTLPSTKKAPAVTAKTTQKISDEEGSPPGTPQSLGSDAMDESDAESEAYSEGVVDDTGAEFPLDGLYKNAQEKRDIQRLPELQREALLEERRQVKDAKDQSAKLRALIEATDAQDKVKKRKAAAADLDESPPKSRAKDKRADALADLKRSRENRDVARRQPTSSRKSRRSRSRSSGSSDKDADGDDDEVEFAEDPIRAAPKVSPDASIEEIERLRLGRTRFKQYCFYPVFERLTMDAFARVQISNGIYKMGQIRGYSTGKPYAMEQPNGRQIMNDQYAEVATGESTKPWPLTHCSDSRFESREYEEFKAALREAGKRVPNQSWAQKKCADLHTLVSYQMSSEEINAKITKQNRLAHLLAQKTSAKPIPTNEHQQRQQRIAERNMNTKLENNRNVREALLAKRAKERAATRAAAAAAAEREAAAKSAALAASNADKNVDDLFGSDISRTGTPTPGTATPDGNKSVRKGMPTFTRRKMDDEIISQMDFGIELDL